MQRVKKPPPILWLRWNGNWNSILSGCMIECWWFAVKSGTVATGDKFIASSEDKHRIAADFGASVCEMEGCAIAQTAFVNGVPFAVVRAISDSADGEATMDYPTFLGIAAANSTKLTLSLVEKW